MKTIEDIVKLFHPDLKVKFYAHDFKTTTKKQYRINGFVDNDQHQNGMIDIMPYLNEGYSVHLYPLVTIDSKPCAVNIKNFDEAYRDIKKRLRPHLKSISARLRDSKVEVTNEHKAEYIFTLKAYNEAEGKFHLRSENRFGDEYRTMCLRIDRNMNLTGLIALGFPKLYSTECKALEQFGIIVDKKQFTRQ